MKVILVSEALPEPFEMESTGYQDTFAFAMDVEERVRALLETERMRSPDEQHKHGLFRK